jgi:hypothetical protein
MDLNATIDIIIKDLHEARDIIDDLKNTRGSTLQTNLRSQNAGVPQKSLPCLKICMKSLLPAKRTGKEERNLKGKE